MNAFLATPSRELRDLMNLAAAAAAIASAHPYAGGFTGNIGDAYSALSTEIDTRCRRHGITEPECWSFFERLRASEGFTSFTMKSLQTFYAEVSCVGR